ncbi:hypothetical protein AHAS_Ahas19G0296800 [Arachis hypogaea]
MGHQAEVPWEDGDERPVVVGAKKVIPHGNWFGPQSSTRHQGRRAPTTTTKAATSSAVARPSALRSTPSAPSIPTAPSSTSQLIYRHVQRLFERIDEIQHRNKQRYEGGTDIDEEEAQANEAEEPQAPAGDSGDDGDDSFHSA